MQALFFMIICINGMLLLLMLGAAIDFVIEKIEQRNNKAKEAIKRNKYKSFRRYK